MKRYLFLRVGLVFLLFLYSISEAASLEEAIVGKWRVEKGGKIIEYLEDGTLLGAHGITGNYKVLSDGRLKIEFIAPFFGRVVEVYQISIQGDKLIQNLPLSLVRPGHSQWFVHCRNIRSCIGTGTSGWIVWSWGQSCHWI